MAVGNFMHTCYLHCQRLLPLNCRLSPTQSKSRAQNEKQNPVKIKNLIKKYQGIIIELNEKIRLNGTILR